MINTIATNIAFNVMHFNSDKGFTVLLINNAINAMHSHTHHVTFKLVLYTPFSPYIPLQRTNTMKIYYALISNILGPCLLSFLIVIY